MWLGILLVGVVLLLLGFWVGKALLFIGLAVLVVSLILALVGRGGRRTTAL